MRTMNLCALVVLSHFTSTGLPQNATELLVRGEYLVNAAGCIDCHTLTHDRPFAGGVKIDATVGPGLKLTFYSPNISSDSVTGIGNWTEADFVKSLREGISPNGSYYYPVYPWRSYTKVTDDDARAMFAYLRALPPVVGFTPKSDIGFPIYNQRWLMWFWKTIFLNRSSDPLVNLKTGPGPFVPLPSKPESWNRGAYLVEGIFHCAECHSPRNAGGAPIAAQWMAGSSFPFGKRYPPNITQDLATGLGSWKRADWLRFLASGISPNGSQPGGEMAQVIRNTARLNQADRQAMVDYLMSLAPVPRKNEGGR